MMTMNEFKNPRIYACDACRDTENKLNISVKRMPKFDCLIPEGLCEENFNREMFAIIDEIHCYDYVCISDSMVYFTCLGEKDCVSHARYYFIVDDNHGYTHAVDRLRNAISACVLRRFETYDRDAIEEMLSMYKALVSKLYISKKSAACDAKEPGLKIYAYFNNFKDRPDCNLPFGVIRLRQIESILDGVQTEEQRLAAITKANQMICDYYSKRGMNAYVTEQNRYLGGMVNYNYDIACYCFVADSIKSEIAHLETEIKALANSEPKQILDNIDEDPDYLKSDLGIKDKDRLWGATRLAQVWEGLRKLV